MKARVPIPASFHSATLPSKGRGENACAQPLRQGQSPALLTPSLRGRPCSQSLGSGQQGGASQRAGAGAFLFLFLLTTTLLAAPLPAAPAANASAPIVSRLPGGMRLLCKPEPGTPLVAIDVFVRTDPAAETVPGLSAFGARALLSSTSNLSPGGMAREIGALGGNMTATQTPDWVQVSVLTTPNKLDDTLFLLADVLQNADFDPDGVEDARQNLMSDMDGQNADTYSVALFGVRRSLWSGTPYAAPPLGTLGDVQRVTRADLRRWYARTFLPSRFVFVAAGAIDPSALASKLTADLSRFPRRDAGRALPPPNVLPTPAADFAARHTTLPGLSEVCVMAGFRGPAPASADYAPFLVANAVLGGMKTSRLFTTLRDKDGLGYVVGSAAAARPGGSELVAFVFSSPTHVDPATKKSVPVVGPVKEGILREADALKTVPVPAAELLRAKHFLIGTDKIRHERLEDRAALLGATALFSPDSADPEGDLADAVRAVTAEDVQRVATKYFIHPAVSVVEPDGSGVPDSE